VKEFAGTYYDGLSSKPVSVRLMLDEQGMLHIEGLPEPGLYELSALRIDPRLGNTTRSISFPGAAKCECDDHEALDEFLRRAGRGKFAALIHRVESSWRGALLATLGLGIVFLIAFKWGIPVLARRVAQGIPPRLAYDLGQGTLAIFDKTLLSPSQLSAEQQHELERDFEGMSASYPDLPLHLVFRRGVGPNAFALPDGTVIVTDELVKLTDEPKEVLAVLAHEIGHVHHRHSLRMALESSTVVLLASAYLGDVTQLTTLSASLPGVYAQAHYSRDHETEADSFALDYLPKNGIAPKHFANALRKLQKVAGPDPERGLQYLASHPPTTERIERFEK
jgi:Zn-dependent protease with chaperone function